MSSRNTASTVYHTAVLYDSGSFVVNQALIFQIKFFTHLLELFQVKKNSTSPNPFLQLVGAAFGLF